MSSLSARTKAASSTLLIARREIVTRATAKSFIVTTALLLVVIVAGIIVWSAFTGDSKPSKIGTAGIPAPLSQQITATAAASGTKIELVPMDSVDQARAQVASGDLKAALASHGASRYTAISKDGLSGTIDGILRSATAQYDLSQALAQRGVNLTQLTNETVFTTTQTTPDKPQEGQRIAIALVVMSLMMFAIMTGGTMVATGVIEEKSSRVVEILLATVRPLHLLRGKILGIGALCLGQVLLLGVAALITSLATGLITIPSTAIWTFLASLAWFVLGFLFFATLYAATGAMVSRQEDLNSTAAPLTILSMAVIYTGYFGIGSLDSSFMRVIAWIPPFSATSMPIRIATGHTDATQIIVTFAVMILTCVVATWVAARIYQRSILRTGSKVSWKDALAFGQAKTTA